MTDQPTTERPGAAQDPRKGGGWTRAILAVFFVCVLAAVAVAVWKLGLLHTLTDKERLIAELRNAGLKGPLACVAMQFVQVVIFVIPGEITQFAAGFVFGMWRGFLYSIAGLILGSAFNFYFARLLGRPTLQKLIGSATLDKVDKLLNSARGKSAIFLLFLIPGTPKDAMSYGAGFSNLTLLEFIVVSSLARSPALFASTLLGSQASRRDYRAMVLTAIVALVAIGLYYAFEHRRKRGA